MTLACANSTPRGAAGPRSARASAHRGERESPWASHRPVPPRSAGTGPRAVFCGPDPPETATSPVPLQQLPEAATGPVPPHIEIIARSKPPQRSGGRRSAELGVVAIPHAGARESNMAGRAKSPERMIAPVACTALMTARDAASRVSARASIVTSPIARSFVRCVPSHLGP